MPVGLGGEQGWWCPTLDDSPDDISGNGNNGTYLGGMGTIADTGSGGTRAYEFDGTYDAITTTFADTATTTTGVFSMACWVKYDTVSNSAGLMAGDVATGKIGLGMLFSNYNSSRGHGGLLNPGVSGQYSGRVYAGDRDTVSTSQWYHVAYTGDGSTSRIYVDGVEMNSASQTRWTTNPWSVPLNLGRNTANGSPIEYLNGRIDDARIFTRTITQADITHLATARGVLGPPSGDNFNAFTNAKYVTRQFSNQRFG